MFTFVSLLYLHCVLTKKVVDTERLNGLVNSG